MKKLKTEVGRVLRHAQQSLHDPFVVKCECGSTHAGADMVQCSHCRRWSHGLCVTLDSIAAPLAFSCKLCAGFIATDNSAEHEQQQQRNIPRCEMLLRMAICAESVQEAILACRSAAHAAWHPVLEGELQAQCEAALEGAKTGNAASLLPKLRSTLQTILVRAKIARQAVEVCDGQLVGGLDRRVLYAIAALSCVPSEAQRARFHVQAGKERDGEGGCSESISLRGEGDCVLCGLSLPASRQARVWEGNGEQAVLPAPAMTAAAVERAGYFLTPREMRILQGIAALSEGWQHDEADSTNEADYVADYEHNYEQGNDRLPPAIPFEELRPMMRPLEALVLRALARCSRDVIH